MRGGPVCGARVAATANAAARVEAPRERKAVQSRYGAGRDYLVESLPQAVISAASIMH